MLSLRKHFLKLQPWLKRISTSTPKSSEDLVVHRDSNDNNSDTPFEFTEANTQRILALVNNYPEGAQRAVLGAALDIAQRQCGWVPISAMHKIADMLSMPRMRVYEWATFYTMIKRKYRGKFHVKVCSTTPCMIRGSEKILHAVELATYCSLGGVSPDGMFGVDIVECSGACVNAPVLIIDDDYYEDVCEADVHNIIRTIRNGNIPKVGPYNGRFASEPVCGPTTLCECPPPPGYKLQAALRGTLSSDPPKK